MNKLGKIIIKLPCLTEETVPIVEEAMKHGVDKFYIEEIRERRIEGATIISPSKKADVVVYRNKREVDPQVKKFSVSLKIEKGEEEAKVVEAAEEGAESVILELLNWRIIPIENLIAKLQKKGTKIYVEKGKEKIGTLLTILQKGVDGVIVPIRNKSELETLFSQIKSVKKLKLVEAEVFEVKETGLGDRACVDTVTMLNKGEGMLVGNQGNFLFLVHSETIENPFVETRPFRVNAGPIHSYILVDENRTKYLSELKSGDEVLTVNFKGESEKVVVGRVKIEKRPLIMLKAKTGEETGSILLQNAETVNLVNKDGNPVSVKKIRKGDKVLVYFSQKKARHFGVEVEEFILEK